MFPFISRISLFCGKLSSWLFFAIGCIIFFEVVARYVFVKPTSWVEEMSRFLQIWATYLAAAYVLKTRHLIAIHVVRDHLPESVALLCRLLALIIMAVFSMVAIWYGTDLALDSIRVGRASSTMLGLPMWMSEIAIPIGFLLLLLQVIAEAGELLFAKKSISGEPRGGQ